MSVFKIFALVSSASLALAHPFTTSSNAIAKFPAGISWDILLNGGAALDRIESAVEDDYQAIDIDLFDTNAARIAGLKDSMKVICYFSAGSREDWRPDAGLFKKGDYKQALDGWAGENWLNVKSTNVRNIMKARIKQAAKNGCTAIDPDNVDGYSGNQDGWGYKKSAYVDYVKFLAKEARANNLAIGLKNALDMIPDVIDVMQFAVNEQCQEHNECELYKPFTDADKAVLHIEYGGSCGQPDGVKLSTLLKPEHQELNILGGACKGQNKVPVFAPVKPSKASPPSLPSSKPTLAPPAPPAPSPSKPGSPPRPPPVPTKAKLPPTPIATKRPGSKPTKGSHGKPKGKPLKGKSKKPCGKPGKGKSKKPCGGK